MATVLLVCRCDYQCAILLLYFRRDSRLYGTWPRADVAGSTKESKRARSTEGDPPDCLYKSYSGRLHLSLAHRGCKQATTSDPTEDWGNVSVPDRLHVGAVSNHGYLSGLKGLTTLKGVYCFIT